MTAMCSVTITARYRKRAAYRGRQKHALAQWLGWEFPRLHGPSHLRRDSNSGGDCTVGQ